MYVVDVNNKHHVLVYNTNPYCDIQPETGVPCKSFFLYLRLQPDQMRDRQPAVCRPTTPDHKTFIYTICTRYPFLTTFIRFFIGLLLFSSTLISYRLPRHSLVFFEHVQTSSLSLSVSLELPSIRIRCFRS